MKTSRLLFIFEIEILNIDKQRFILFHEILFGQESFDIFFCKITFQTKIVSYIKGRNEFRNKWQLGKYSY